MQRGSRGCSTRGGTPRFELGVAREAGQSATSCDFGAIVAWHEARRASKPALKAGALCPRDENLLAELEVCRCGHPKSALASAACEQRWRGVAEARSRRRGEAIAETRSRMRRVARPPVRSPLSLRAPPSSSGGASCRAKGARPAPFPRVPHRHEQRRHRAAPDVELRFGGCYRPTALTTEIPLCSAAVSQ